MPISGFSLVNYVSSSEADRRGGKNLFSSTLVAYFISKVTESIFLLAKKTWKDLEEYIPYHLLLTEKAKVCPVWLDSLAEIELASIAIQLVLILRNPESCWITAF